MPGTVLITGATGFAGSFLVDHYLREGWEVHGTYRRGADERSRDVRGVVMHRVELTEPDAVRKLVASVKPGVVHHLAAQSSVSASLADPTGTLWNNASAQHQLLTGIVDAVPEARVLVVGSCDEYGDVEADANPIVETQELRPLTSYALSKVVQDLMGYQFHAMLGLRVVRVRPFLQIGPRREDRFVAGSFARQIAEVEAGHREPVIKVGNVDLRRDFTDVRDVVRAFALLAESGVAGDVYNVASGEAHTLRDILAVMAELAGITIDIRPSPRLQRHGEPSLLVGSAARLRAVTGWKPEIPFEQSVQDTLDYWRERIRQDRATKG